MSFDKILPIDALNDKTADKIDMTEVKHVNKDLPISGSNIKG